MAQSNSALQRHEVVLGGRAVHACQHRNGVGARGRPSAPPCSAGCFDRRIRCLARAMRSEPPVLQVPLGWNAGGRRPSAVATEVSP